MKTYSVKIANKQYIFQARKKQGAKRKLRDLAEKTIKLRELKSG